MEVLLTRPGEQNDGAEQRMIRGRQRYLFVVERFILSRLKQHISGGMIVCMVKTVHRRLPNVLMKIANK